MSALQLGPLDHQPRNIRPPFEVPTPGPARAGQDAVEHRRPRSHADKLAALHEPLAGIDLGTYDEQIIDWLAKWDTDVVGTVVSLLYRARQAGRDESRGTVTG
ncbi:hypothetical protein [Pseudonocardia acidicola]|uniref:Uncharacterized protein n=1 Tax=Pseudonocardia acidicola TaxID=2724939 RepID=A0ABX1SC96_9PSEU|nr:hypothetical protein [Pseudonocardia acidicola]NMH98118.1 hypothetical protein [Pseudonocardia acidicola]